MFFLYCVCYDFMRDCLYVPCGHLLRKGRPLGSRLWCLTVSLSLSHWYPGSGVVLYCNDSELCILTTLWSPAGKGLTSWLSFVVSHCKFVTFQLVSWVRCGT